MRHASGCRVHDACTSNVVRHLCERLGLVRRDVLAVGRHDEHVCILRAAGVSVAVEAPSEAARRASDVVVESLADVLAVADRA